MFKRITASYKSTSLTGEPVTSVRRRRTWDLDSPGTRLCRSNCHSNSICNKRKVSWKLTIFWHVCLFKTDAAKMSKRLLRKWDNRIGR